MVSNFCTYFDSNYLIRGLALYRSLKWHCQEFCLWILCMDRESYEILNRMALPNIELISLEVFERGDNKLQKAKQNRSKTEYYFTCTPSLPLFILNNFPDVDLITYIDADLLFFNDPASLFEEIANHSIAIIGHRFSDSNKENIAYGIYNVGWLSFRRDKNGFACLNWWRQKCNEWCYDRIEGGRFADQRYLDDWPTRFKNVVVLQNKGANLAPWNMANYSIQADGKNVLIDGQPLIFFHFHGFRHLIWRIYCTGLSFYKVRINNKIRHFLYGPYFDTLLSVNKDLLEKSDNCFSLASARPPVHVSLLRKICAKIKYFLSLIYHVIVFKDYIVIPKG